MLFSLKYVTHTVENLHKYIEHTILEVCCKPNGAFAVNKLHPDFQAIVEEVSKNQNDYLKKPIEAIYIICQKLTVADLQQLADAFKANNAIEELCEGKIKPVLYEDIEKIDKPLSDELKQWGKDLYNHVLSLAPFTSRNGQLMDYYKDFMVANANGVCPFCGLSDLKSDLLSKREAYDHYFPKDKYPFNTVNFKNLVPACYTCNSSYKLIKDPINKGKQKAFYPFSTAKPTFEIKVKIASIDFEDPKKNVVSINFSSTQQSEVDAWRTTYGIDERYDDKCRSDDSKYWLEKIRESRNHGYDMISYLDLEIRIGKMFPFKDKNFLRVPFLEDCINYGIFS